jgi:cell division protein ZipA
MNITSILITIVGIIFIIALYLMSRISQSKFPKIQSTQLPDIKDENGAKFTSVLDDIPARDGSTPLPRPAENFETDFVDSSTDRKTGSKHIETERNTQQTQIVLFISAKDENGLDGNTVKQSLIKNGLSFGDKEIYHYIFESSVNNQKNKKSLFRVANGVDPWTLTDQDLVDKKLVGLSIIMFIPTKTNNNKAIQVLLNSVEKIANDVNGLLKNQQQQILTQKDKELLLSQ